MLDTIELIFQEELMLIKQECDICHYRKCLQNSFLVYEQDDAIRRMNNPNLIDKERDLYFVVLIYKKRMSPLKNLIIKETKK